MFFDGVAWGILYVAFVFVIWGDLAQNKQWPTREVLSLRRVTFPPLRSNPSVGSALCKLYLHKQHIV